MVYTGHARHGGPVRCPGHLPLPPDLESAVRQQSLLDLHLSAVLVECIPLGPRSQQHLLRHPRLPISPPPQLPRTLAPGRAEGQQRFIQIASEALRAADQRGWDLG